jgi:hypothetical protein
MEELSDLAKTRHLTLYHEAGHAVTAFKLRCTDIEIDLKRKSIGNGGIAGGGCGKVWPLNAAIQSKAMQLAAGYSAESIALQQLGWSNHMNPNSADGDRKELQQDFNEEYGRQPSDNELQAVFDKGFAEATLIFGEQLYRGAISKLHAALLNGHNNSKLYWSTAEINGVLEPIFGYSCAITLPPSNGNEWTQI